MPIDDAQVAGLLGLGQPAELADLEVDDVHREVGVGPQQHVDAVDGLVEHERMIGLPPDGEALFVAQAGLLDVDVDVADRPDDAHRLVLRPAGVGVGDQAVGRAAARRGPRGCGRCRRPDRRRP